MTQQQGTHRISEERRKYPEGVVHATPGPQGAVDQTYDPFTLSIVSDSSDMPKLLASFKHTYPDCVLGEAVHNQDGTTTVICTGKEESILGYLLGWMRSGQIDSFEISNPSA